MGYELRRQAGRGSAYVGLRLAKGVAQEQTTQDSPQKISNSATENQNQCSRVCLNVFWNFKMSWQ